MAEETLAPEVDAKPGDAPVGDAPAPPVDAKPEIDAAKPEADPPVAETDWRADLAGEDEKLAKFLGKYPSVKALAAAAKASNDKLLQRAAAKLPESPTDEEMAAFRKEHGIPEKADGYLDKLPDGLVIGDDDKAAVSAFLDRMHAANTPKPMVDAALSAYYDFMADQEGELIGRREAYRSQTEDALRAEWGPAEYKRNINAANAFLGTLPGDVGAALVEAVSQDGLPLTNNPKVLEWIVGMAMEANPLNTVVPGGGTGQAEAVADELAALKVEMRDREGPYWKGPKAAAMQARAAALYEAMEKMKGQ